MDNSTNTTKVIGALLAGVAIGGILGVLFAPRKGSETRRKIAAQSDRLAAIVEEKLDEIRLHAKNEFENAKSSVQEFARNGVNKQE